MKDIYMAKREDETLTRITVECYDKRYIVESPYSDTDAIDELLRMVYAIGVTMTYAPDTVLTMMRDFVKEHTQEKEEL